MNINITLFIQMIHFWIAFFVLRALLWKPILAILVKEEQEQESLEHALIGKRTDIAHSEHRRERLWYAARQQFLMNIPALAKTNEAFTTEKTNQPLSEKLFNEQLVKEVAAHIVSKVDNV